MYEAVRISPSILSADFMNMERDIRMLEAAGAQWVHVDVMDGHFVPNLTLGVPFAKQLRGVTDLPIDVHLMIDNPLEEVPWFIACKPDIVTVHWEALDPAPEQAVQLSEMLRSAGIKAGIALKPDTPVSVLDGTLDLWDMVLIMSVYPGFSGQSYIPESGPRVAELTKLCRRGGFSPLIQVDGGINRTTACEVAREGADVLVAGNAVFKADDSARAIADILQAANEAGEGGVDHG